MKTLIKLSAKFGVYSLLLVAAVSNVNATPIVTLSGVNQTTSSVSGVTVVDFNSGCGYASCSGDYKIVTGSSSGYYAQPYGTDTAYLSVPNPSPTSHSATFELGTTANYFGLFWGSIDSYNSISFFLKNTQVGSFSGTDIVGLNANGNQVGYSSNRYVNFEFAGAMFDTVKLTSSNFAFESDNHAYRQTASLPEPTPLALIALGLISLVSVRRFQKH